MTPKERLREIIGETQTLAAKGVMEGEDAKRFAALRAEAEGLKSQMEQQAAMAEVVTWANSSAGGLPVASGTQEQQPPASLAARTAESALYLPAGAMTFEHRQSGLRLAEAYGEGIFSSAALQATNSVPYHDAFKSYMRKGREGLSTAELRALQEGIDTEGGLAA